MNKTISKYQQGGIIAFLILALCVTYALYKTNSSENVSREAKTIATLAITNEQNRYENCLEANKAIAKLNVVVRSQKQVLALAQESPEVIQSGRAVKYAEIAEKLTESVKLNCLQPRSPTGAVGATRVSGGGDWDCCVGSESEGVGNVFYGVGGLLGGEIVVDFPHGCGEVVGGRLGLPRLTDVLACLVVRHGVE